MEKNTKETSTTSCFYPCWKKCNQPINIQTTTNMQREGSWLKYKIKTKEVSKLSQIIQLDILRSTEGTLCPGAQWCYGRMEVLLLVSARIHSSVCFNSLRTNFSRSLLDFNSSSRHCFILLFSYDGKILDYQTKEPLLQVPSALSLGSLHYWLYFSFSNSSLLAPSTRQPPDFLPLSDQSFAIFFLEIQAFFKALVLALF